MGLFDKKYNDSISLIDGSNMFCRSALVDFKGSEIDFNVRINNFFKMFKSATKNNPKYCAIVFDSGQENFRHKIYPQYKADRKKAYIKDKDLLLKAVKKILLYSGFTVLGSNDYEADDVIGSLSTFACKETPVTIYSNDKDFMQLINDYVTVNKDHKIYNKKAVFYTYGVYPEQFVEYLTLVGDKADCVPGVRLWGKKTTSEYLQKYGDIKTIKQQELKKSLSAIYDVDNVSMCKKLVTIKKDLKVIKSLDDISIKERNYDKLNRLFKQYKIGSIYG